VSTGLSQGPRRRQLSEEAAGWVRASIMSGELRPGEVVRPEVVGELLGISTTPAREGLHALRVEGFLQLQPRRGFVVAELTGDDIRDLFTVQALIAGELAARAAARADEADLDELEALHHEMIAAAARRRLEELEEKNHAFHRHLNLLVPSPKLAWALGLMTRYVPRRFYATIPGWPQATVEDHGRILAALRDRDPDRSRQAMHEHVVRAGELLAQHFRTPVEAPGTSVAREEPSVVPRSDHPG
jgi:DNA-binding GntR family transcriptional regulator